MLSNTVRLNFCYLKVIHILHQRYHQKVMAVHILKTNQENKAVCIHRIMRLIIIKMVMKMKNRTQRCDINIEIYLARVNIKSVSICCCLHVLSNT